MPRISRSLLSQRLRFLESVGLVERQAARRGRAAAYHLPDAGRDLYDVIVRLGEWSQRWFDPLIDEDALDPSLLMWDIQRRLNSERLPDRRVVVQFDFLGACAGSRWLLLEPGEPSVCWDPPGFDVDLVVRADTLAMHRVWLGHLGFADALRSGLIELNGPRDLVRGFPEWLALSLFAPIRGVYRAMPTAAG